MVIAGRYRGRRGENHFGFHRGSGLAEGAGQKGVELLVTVSLLMLCRRVPERSPILDTARGHPFANPDFLPVRHTG